MNKLEYAIRPLAVAFSGQDALNQFRPAKRLLGFPKDAQDYPSKLIANKVRVAGMLPGRQIKLRVHG
jgi:hypothetical protein